MLKDALNSWISGFAIFLKTLQQVARDDFDLLPTYFEKNLAIKIYMTFRCHLNIILK